MSVKGQITTAYGDMEFQSSGENHICLIIVGSWIVKRVAYRGSTHLRTNQLGEWKEETQSRWIRRVDNKDFDWQSVSYQYVCKEMIRAAEVFLHQNPELIDVLRGYRIFNECEALRRKFEMAKQTLQDAEHDYQDYIDGPYRKLVELQANGKVPTPITDIIEYA